MGYTIKELRDNIGIDKDHPSFATFDVLTEYKGDTRWLSVPHELYFPWALMDSQTLQDYIEKRNFKNWEDAIKDLTELEYDWLTQMTKYIEKYYPKKEYEILPRYNPDKLNGQLEFDDDDDIEDDKI